MFKRARWMTVGYVAGIGTSYALAKKVKQTVSQLTPPELARRSAARVRDAVADGTDAARAREEQLRREYGPRPRLRAVGESLEPGTSRDRPARRQ